MKRVIAFILDLLAFALTVSGFIGRAYIGKGAIALVFIGIFCAIAASTIGGSDDGR